MRPNSVYVVLVNFRAAADTIECLASLGRLDWTDFAVVVVDNASNDGSAAAIGRWMEEARVGTRDGDWSLMPGEAGGFALRLIEHPRNGGFAAGCNVGIALAMSDPDCRYVWLLNNDTIVEPGALRFLVERASRDERVGMCGSTLIYQEPAGVVQACGGRFSLSEGRGWLLGAMASPDALPRVEDVEARMNYVVGASMLVTRRFIGDVGPMDERYFLYFEELDWAIRGASRGYSLGWADKSLVVHKEGASIGTSTKGAPSPLSTFFMTASYLRIVYAHERRLLPRALAVVIGRALKRAAAGRFGEGLTVLRGAADFVGGPARHG